MGTMIIEDQTGIQASPIQHLTTIFLGSSYRKSTWTIDPLIQVLFEMNSHHILLHSSLHIVEVLHLLWLVIIPQRATTPSPYLRVQWKLVLRRWKQHFVLPWCHSYLMPAAIWKQTFWWFWTKMGEMLNLASSSTPAILDPKRLLFNFQSSWYFSEMWQGSFYHPATMLPPFPLAVFNCTWGQIKGKGKKKVLHTGERTQPNQPTQHTDTEFQGARGAGGIKSCSSARTLVPSRQFKTGQTNSWILVSNKKFPNKMWKAFEEITQQQNISTDSRHLKKFLDGQTGSSRTLLINIHTCNGLLDWSGIFLFHDRFQIFTLNDSYLEFGDDDSLRTTWTFAAEAAAQVWHGTHPDFAGTKSRPKSDSVQR